MMDFFFNKRRNLTKCCIKNCRSLEVDPELLSNFTFSKDSSRCAVWLDNCGLPHFRTIDTSTLNKNYRLCSMHFENCMFRNEQNNSLKPDAIPTLFESTSQQHTIENYADDNHETVNDCMLSCSTPSMLFLK